MNIVEYASHFIGKPYIWGGNGSVATSGGFDCSGLVIECLQAFGLLPKGDWTAQRLYLWLSNCGWKYSDVGLAPSQGGGIRASLSFFGKDVTQITHVALDVDGYQSIEAGGGDKKSKQGMVRIRTTDWRKPLCHLYK